MRKLLPVLLALIGLGAGVGAGIALKPDHDVVEINPCGEAAPEPGHGEVEAAKPAGDNGAADTGNSFVKMNNQFVVPVVNGGRVTSLVVLSLSLEIEQGANEGFYQREPKLRDAFLQVLFDHANAGGFDGVFTDSSKLIALRQALRETAIKTVGEIALDVVVTDIMRQDI